MGNPCRRDYRPGHMGRLVRRARTDVQRAENALRRSIENEYKLREQLVRERAAREQLEQRAEALSKAATNE